MLEYDIVGIIMIQILYWKKKRTMLYFIISGSYSEEKADIMTGGRKETKGDPCDLKKIIGRYSDPTL